MNKDQILDAIKSLQPGDREALWYAFSALIGKLKDDGTVHTDSGDNGPPPPPPKHQ